MSILPHRGMSALVIVALLGGCGKSKPEEPTPEPTVTTTWTPPADPRPAPSDDGAAEQRSRLEERIHFGYDRADLSPEAKQVLARKADLLQQMAATTVRIEGHADERGSDEYNLALGTRRAIAAKQYLVARGVSSSRIEVVSLGEERPLDPGHGERAWAANRRAEFRAGSLVSAR